MTDHTLLPCPFCGGEAELLKGAPGLYSAENHLYHAKCQSCGASAYDHGRDGAIAAWNRRTPPAAVPDAVAAIKFALTIDDHFDRLEFLYAFLDGSVDTDEEWDDWHEYRAMISAAPAAPTKARDE